MDPEILKMIPKYFKFIGAYEIVEHFIDLNKNLTTKKRSGASTDELLAYQNISFHLIFDDMKKKLK